MNYIDFIIIIVVIAAAIRGAIKGFVYEIASLIALIAGVWGAIKFSGATETYLVKRLNFTNEYIDIIAFVITMVIIIILVHLIGKAVEKILKSVALGTVNRFFGLIFASAKALFILGVLVVVIDKIDESLPFIPKDNVAESKFYNPLKNIAISTFPFIQGFYEDIKDKADDKKEDIIKKKIDKSKDTKTSEA